MAENKNEYFYAIGRRKTATATVRLYEKQGESSVNDKPLQKVYGAEHLVNKLMLPFIALNLEPKKFFFTAKARGGGPSAQLEAIRLGLSRALIKLYPEKKKDLKNHGLTTRDPRMVERKKAGLRKARKAEQYSKR